MKVQWRRAHGGGYVTFDLPGPGKYVITRSQRPGTSRTDWTVLRSIADELIALTVCDRLGEAKRYAQRHANWTWAP